MSKYLKLLGLLLVLGLLVVGCTKDKEAVVTEDETVSATQEDDTEGLDQDTEDEAVTLSYDGELILSGLGTDSLVAFNDIYAMESVTQNVHHISSTGEESDDQVTGVLLDTVLAEFGVEQRDFASIRLVAGDGYEITVPSEVIANHDIILAYKFNGEDLEENKMPLRAAIDGVRSMYFVSNLKEIAFLDEEVEDSKYNNPVVMLETAVLSLEAEEYVYYDSSDLAVTVADLLASVSCTSEGDVHFLAADGLQKTETMAVFSSGYIKFTGEDAPLFIDPDLPKGMYIKSIMKAEASDKTFVSVASALVALGETVIEDKTGVAMVDFFKKLGIESGGYILTAIDGYQVEISKEDSQDGIFYIHDETGRVGMKFTEEYEKAYNMKDILTIEVVSEDEADIDSANSDAPTGLEWTITFDGLADGSFDMTSERAERKLELVELSTERTKNDEKISEDWTGYRILDMLEFLHVEDFSSLILVANDGYEVEIQVGDIDRDSIIAVTKNGEPIDEEFKVQFVQNTEFSTTWVKGLATVIVKGSQETSETPDIEIELVTWTITFDGLSDGSFDFTSEKAFEKMTLVEIHTEKEKDDVKYPEVWTGYRVSDILDWLKVESYSSLSFVANDGYSIDIPASEIDEETIIAITKDGEPIDSEFKVQLVQNTRFATTWVKGVVKIIVNE